MGHSSRAWGIAALLAVVAGPVGAEDRIETLERKIDELRREVEELRRGESEAAPAPVAAPDSGTQGLADVAQKVRIGGYGSVRFEANSADDQQTTFTFRRFVLTADAAPAPRMRAYLELELERFRKLELERSAKPDSGGLEVEQEVEGTSDSEIALEQAWFEYAFSDALRVRTGGLLVPLGRFNLNHDDNRWTLPRRSLADRGAPVLPAASAWDELGVGVYGRAPVGETSEIDYQILVVNGVILEPEVEEVIHTREPSRDKLELEAKFNPQTGTFGNDVKDAKAVTGRAAFSPSLGHEVGGSFYWGRYTPDFLPGEAITAFGIDGLSTFGGFELEGQWVYSDFGDVGNIARAFAGVAGEQSNATPSTASPTFESEIEFELDSLAETRHGYWLELRRAFRPAWLRDSVFGQAFEDPQLVAVVRGEQVWIDDLLSELDFTGGAVTALSTTDHRLDRISIGGAYRPIPLVAFQLAYEFTQVDEGGLGSVTNFLATDDDEAHALLLGATFGF